MYGTWQLAMVTAFVSVLDFNYQTPEHCLANVDACKANLPKGRYMS
jgi:hypothetical protein